MKTLYVVLLTSLICLSCASQNRKSSHHKSVEIYSSRLGKEIKHIVDKHAKKALEDSLINSLSIGLYVYNVSLSFNYGALTQGGKDTPTNKTIYEIASVTKTFTGTLAAKAVLEGKLRLEDDIRRYLPKRYPNLEYKGKPIRIKHLLTHTSGLPSGILGMDQKEFSKDLSEIEFNQRYTEFEKLQTKSTFFRELSKLKITQEPGTKFEYSNPGSNLMGYILEVVYNMEFQQLVMDKIVRKIQMEDTHFNTSDDSKNRLAKGYLLQNEMPETPLAKTLWGAEGAMKSTVSDMLKYMHYHLGKYSIMILILTKQVKLKIFYFSIVAVQCYCLLI